MCLTNKKGPGESLCYTCYEDLTISEVPNYAKKYMPSDEQRFAIVWTQRLWWGRKQSPRSIHNGEGHYEKLVRVCKTSVKA